MALTIIDKKEYPATEDIVVYATVFIYHNVITSAVEQRPIELDTVCFREMKHITDKFMAAGFQVYMNKEDAKRLPLLKHEHMFECVIPKGAKYYEGLKNSFDAFISNKLIYKKKIS